MQRGFTLIELLITLAIVGVVGTVANSGYQVYIAKSQSAEALVMMNKAKSSLVKNIMTSKSCLIGSGIIEGKYGVLSAVGKVDDFAYNFQNKKLKTGCSLRYQFVNTSPAHAHNRGRIIQLEVFNNAVLSKSDLTTVPEKILGQSITKIFEDDRSVLVMSTVPELNNILNKQVVLSDPGYELLVVDSTAARSSLVAADPHQHIKAVDVTRDSSLVPVEFLNKAAAD